jgi:leucine dehydrogenase
MIDVFDQNSIKDLPEYDNHRILSYIQDKKAGLEGFIAIHRAKNGVPSFGATRLWSYGTETEAIKDALRLSKMMSYKAALAGLECGGAKGVIMYKPEQIKTPETRKRLFQAYGSSLALFNGNIATGTDVGVFQEDLPNMKNDRTHIVGFNDNATEFTAIGVFESIKVCLEEVFETSELTGKSFAIQGLGKVGEELLCMIYKETNNSAKIFVSDINENTIKNIQKKFPNVIAVKPEDIHKQEVDVYCPCALSGVLNPATISEMKSRVICGSANNQLSKEEVGVLLYKLGILYAPDYVVNAGGLIAVYDEYQNKKYDKKRVMDKVAKIPSILSDILVKSFKQRKATNIIANKMAEKIFNAYD